VRRSAAGAAALALMLAGSRPATAGWERVAPAVLDAFRAAPAGRASLLVRWTGVAALPAPRSGETRPATRRRVVAALRSRAEAGAVICARLSRLCGDLHPQPLWIINAAAVSADRRALLALAHQPGVDAVLAPPPLRLMQGRRTLAPLLAGLLAAPVAVAPEPLLPWNILKLQAPEVWTQGIMGDGVVVANIDTGVDATHPALQGRYRGLATGGDEWNWLDVVSGRAAPYDDLGHGTQTMSSIVGDGGPGNQIGVAPGARWMAVKAASAGGALDLVNVLRAMQWLLAPTDRNGENPDPDRAPDVVSNSWGDYPGADETLRDAVRAWVAAGIVPVFSAGNNGVGSMSSPASYPESIAVGAVDGQDEVASFSSRGPSPIDGAVKPDVVAPGVLIPTAVPGRAYFPDTGTSFAAPQVAGIAALLRQANPGLTPPEIADVLRSTADPVAPLPLPNNDVGWGRVNALTAVNRARPPWPGL
jgi:bacillopeptidase F